MPRDGAADHAERFLDRLDGRSAVVGIVGLGYVGLPLAMGFADVGFRVVGLDVQTERVARLNSGRSHIEDVGDDTVGPHVKAGRFVATTDPSVLAAADAVFISVPTPFDDFKTPDLGYVRRAAESVQPVLRPGMLVVLQSTTYPGTTEEVVRPILERGGMRAGSDFFLAFSPERVDPGNSRWGVRNTPKVVGGTTPTCARMAAGLLQALMLDGSGVTVLSSPAAAEMTKLLENTYRAVNIALVNELAVLAHEMGIDIWEVVDGAATKPFGFERFQPGIGPGGHCIPVDPYYLAWRARSFDFQTKFIELAADTNLRMANYVVGRIMAFVNRLGRSLLGASVLALGVSFKPGVADVRNSRALRVIELLEAAGAKVVYSDPLVATVNFGGRESKSVDVTAETLASVDLVVVLVAHRGSTFDRVLAGNTPVFDAVNALGVPARPHHERL